MTGVTLTSTRPGRTPAERSSSTRPAGARAADGAPPPETTPRNPTNGRRRKTTTAAARNPTDPADRQPSPRPTSSREKNRQETTIGGSVISLGLEQDKGYPLEWSCQQVASPIGYTSPPTDARASSHVSEKDYRRAMITLATVLWLCLLITSPHPCSLSCRNIDPHI